ncbi:MAG: 16S rRNA (uracil(1498)-N(3))-methyltransferase, partial [Candidatus Omnitrophica bacterium]|nr:16S rRNA (uracil(1498)-N(3))-methyltransferase [Candidatus Omnitrophota bacterium]
RTAHYLVRVLRVKTGDVFSGFDGQGNEYLLAVKSITTRSIILSVLEKSQNLSRENPQEIILFQSVPKAEKMDRIVREATYLGVSRIFPMTSQRVIPNLGPDQFRRRKTRWLRIASEAARLSGRAIIPEIGELVDFSEALNYPVDQKLLFWEKATQLLSEPLRQAKGVGIYIGPEGGFSDEEVAIARKSGCLICSLGVRILAVETASLVALAIVSYQLLAASQST